MPMNFAQFSQMHQFDPTGYERLKQMSPVPQGGYDPHGGTPIPQDPRGGVSAGGPIPRDPRATAPTPIDPRTGGGMMTPNQHAPDGQHYRETNMAHPVAHFHGAAAGRWGHSPLLQAIVGLLAGQQGMS